MFIFPNIIYNTELIFIGSLTLFLLYKLSNVAAASSEQTVWLKQDVKMLICMADLQPLVTQVSSPYHTPANIKTK